MRTMSMIAIACSVFAASCLRESQGTPSEKRELVGYGAPDRAALIAEPSTRAAPLTIGPLGCEAAARLRGPARFNLAHLGRAALSSMEFLQVRTTGSAVTLSGWRMEIASGQGKGAIFALEQPSATCYVGYGVFSDWPRTDLERAYRQLAPKGEPVDLGSVQLD